MIIQHNIPALNSYNKLSTNNSNLAKNLEKLSSGYRINRAGDDAAGLAISEKMRAQITGLEMATRNAKDGVSLIQTAEGALTEVHSMLNRLVELSTQAANGTYQNHTDRQYIQDEVDELLGAIDQISTTDYNGINLLNGTLGGLTNSVTGTDVTKISMHGVDSSLAALLGTINVTADDTQAGFAVTFAATPFSAAANMNYAFVRSGSSGNDTRGGSVTFELQLSATTTSKASDLALMEQLKDLTITVEHGQLTVSAPETIAATATTWTGNGMTLQIGDKNVTEHQLNVSIADMSAKGLSIDGLSVGTADLAMESIDIVKSAIDAVNKQRDYLGAKQNRLEHTINNLETTTENLTDAESRIRDTDMAKEMMKYTKNSILVQSAQAMLAQANQLPSSVLNLLY